MSSSLSVPAAPALVRLHVLPDLTLVIPTVDIQRLTLKPIKWLHYVAWAILGVDGRVSSTPGGVAEEDLENERESSGDEEVEGEPVSGLAGKVYYYIVSGALHLIGRRRSYSFTLWTKVKST